MKFTPEDFEVDVMHEGHLCSATPAEIAAQANAKLAQWLAESPTVYSEEGDTWDRYDVPIGSTPLKAKLVCVEELK